MELHLLRIVIQDCRSVVREILRDGDDHVVITVPEALLRSLIVDETVIQGSIFLKVLDEFIAYRDLLAVIHYGNVLIDHCHRELVELTVRIPHGSEEESRIYGRDQYDGRQHHDEQRVMK